MQTVVIALTFVLQGCASNDTEAIKLDKGGYEEMATDLTSQLFQAVEKGELDTLQNALDQKVDINAQDSKKRTALMIATYNQDVEAVKLLIDAGANVNIQDDLLNTPFLYAGAEGYLDILKLTIQAGADPTIVNRYGGTALIPAAEHGHVEVIEELLNNTTIDVNHVNRLGWTALMEAIILNNGNLIQQTVVQLLIDHGADVNIPDNDNVTPLQHAKKQGFKEIENILFTAGAE
ncbi:ankyrin repeat domain-containing protein [Lysinibacillus pakistanensis]|uniref:Ankyrin repeat domain-containing protein n=1 Tax=Lysinibacillus pakistanensis TaxID=759811 RepID=A0AAX3X3C5_9BACI|nr:ankyrin repeat domain-containing protein [Lysinibacillus pakistanensis]MDM5233065.1 ankyrin repeat domain-containing protein [Lysinibacillus pakistanensis]WHY49154.1 ankyrin repeat domain-containing protein [Lysinibacillus pakistanensis]WHY54164.1 ankyrin repeat domain-containing protein [Lysinibacillus pakistanensis]